MATVLFVHGTGVRKGSYLSTFAILQRSFERHALPHVLAPCLWGDDLGAKPPDLSVPDRRAPAVAATALTADQEYARWELLYRDPLFELRLLESRPSRLGPRAPTAGQTGRAVWLRIESYEPSERVRAILADSGMFADWPATRTRVLTDNNLAREVLEGADDIGEPARAVARALVADLIRVAGLASRPVPTAARRDLLVDALLDDWRARVAGIGTTLVRFFGGLAATIGTPLVRWKRGEITNAASFVTGDILLYQVRGDEIRAYVRRCIEAVDGDVVLLGHSLGGIAAVDLLLRNAIPKVTRLITVGSQAPMFHEMGALWGLEPGARILPDAFPRWLNIYDPYDFLSYLARGVFPSSDVEDHRVESGQPFPQSHSAYWDHPDTWTKIQQFLA